MGQHFLPGNPPIALNLRQSARARRITLRVSALDGRVTLTLPRGISESEALDFAREKEPWLRKHLGKQPERTTICEGAQIPFEGRMMRLMHAKSRGVSVHADALHLKLDDDRGGARLRGWLKEKARARLTQASDRYSTHLGKPYSSIALRDTRSRWGSCSSRGTLSYSWRLIMAPPRVLDYVAAHEVAHLKHMDHSSAFWATVDALYGPHRAERDWLRREGTALHAIRFDAETDDR